MTDISDLACLNFEDLAQADLFDLVSNSSGMEPEVKGEPRSPSPVSSLDRVEEYTSITLINGEQICLRDHEEDDFCENSQDSMDLNSILQGGVVERVAPASHGVSSTSQLDSLGELDWEPEEDRRIHRPLIMSTVLKVDTPAILSTLKPVARPRATILASQLPLPIPASARLLDRRIPAGRTSNTVIISSSDKTVQASEVSQANNNNSLLRSALTNRGVGNQGGQVLLSDLPKQGQQANRRTVLASLKTEDSSRQEEDILLLSLEGREAVARLKDGASQLFPNTRVTSDTQAPREAPNVISIEVDVSGNLVLHKSPPSPSDPPTPPQVRVQQELSPQLTPRKCEGGQLMSLQQSHLAKVRKYHRRPREEPKKESRLLHYCHICNKGFKDKYSVNVHVRTHTGEKPFSCSLCGKCFRQKAHLAKHQQTHAAKQAGDSNVVGVVKLEGTDDPLAMDSSM